MLKAILCYSKKIPIPDQAFSSQSYHLSLETEIAEGLGQDKIQQKIHDTFELVKTSVEQELQAGRGQKDAVPVVGNKADGERSTFAAGKATNRQIKFVLDLCRDRDRPISLNELNAQVKQLYGVDSLYSLSKADASKLVESLKRDQRKAA